MSKLISGSKNRDIIFNKAWKTFYSTLWYIYNLNVYICVNRCIQPNSHCSGNISFEWNWCRKHVTHKSIKRSSLILSWKVCSSSQNKLSTTTKSGKWIWKPWSKWFHPFVQKEFAGSILLVECKVNLKNANIFILMDCPLLNVYPKINESNCAFIEIIFMESENPDILLRILSERVYVCV